MTLDGLAIGADNKLIPIGATLDGESCAGSDWVRVVDVVPRRR